MRCSLKSSPSRMRKSVSSRAKALRNMESLTGAKVTKLDKAADSVAATIDAGGKVQTIRADRVISALGVVGNTENLGLEALGVETKGGIITTDPFSRTNVPGLYAIGDVAGAPMLAHKAVYEGVV